MNRRRTHKLQPFVKQASRIFNFASKGRACPEILVLIMVARMGASKDAVYRLRSERSWTIYPTPSILLIELIEPNLYAVLYRRIFFMFCATCYTVASNGQAVSGCLEP